MCAARRTVNGKSIYPASVNHVSYRVCLVVSLNWSTVAVGAEGNSGIGSAGFRTGHTGHVPRGLHKKGPPQK